MSFARHVWFFPPTNLQGNSNGYQFWSEEATYILMNVHCGWTHAYSTIYMFSHLKYGDLIPFWVVIWHFPPWKNQEVAIPTPTPKTRLSSTLSFHVPNKILQASPWIPQPISLVHDVLISWIQLHQSQEHNASPHEASSPAYETTN